MNEENRSPSLEDFKSHVRKRFTSLITEFGMREVDPMLRNDFSVALANDTTRIEVEGINWGFGLQVFVGARGLVSPADPQAPETPLWALVKYKAPEEFEKLTSSSRQLELIERHAQLLRKHLPEVLSGEDNSVIEEVNSRFTPQEGFAI